MSATAAIASKSWTVGTRTVTLTMPSIAPGKPAHIAIEWSSEPSRLTADEWAEYRAGRNHAIAQIAAELGVNVAVIEA